MPRGKSNAKPQRYLRVRVNPIKCTAFGFCTEYLPEVFDLDDWGYAWLRRTEVPMSLKDAVYETAKCCPTGAITVEVVDEPDPGATTLEQFSRRSERR
jgi:ferredoxin